MLNVRPLLAYRLIWYCRPKRTKDSAEMCEYTKNYYVYTSCLDPGAHFFSTSVDGNRDRRCARGPHERYIVVPGHCPLCNSWLNASFDDPHEFSHWALHFAFTVIALFKGMAAQKHFSKTLLGLWPSRRGVICWNLGRIWVGVLVFRCITLSSKFSFFSFFSFALGKRELDLGTITVIRYRSKHRSFLNDVRVNGKTWEDSYPSYKSNISAAKFRWEAVYIQCYLLYVSIANCPSLSSAKAERALRQSRGLQRSFVGPKNVQ